MRRRWRGWPGSIRELLYPVKHRSAQAQADLMMIRARAGLVRARTALVNTARGLAKCYGERLRGCNVRNMNPEKAEGLESGTASRTGTAVERNRVAERAHRGIQRAHRDSWRSRVIRKVALLKQIKGVGTLIALTYMLTLEDPHRFRKSRDVGCYLGLQPGRRNSGQSEPQLHISKEGDPYLRTLLVQGAQHILGPFGIDCDLRRWGLKLAERGGKKREEASDRRHRKKAGGAAASPVGERRSVRTVAQQQPNDSGGSRVEQRQKQSQNRSRKRKDKSPKPSSGDCVNGLAQVPL